MRRLALPLLLLAMLGGCIINPVPTPGAGSAAPTDSNFRGLHDAASSDGASDTGKSKTDLDLGTTGVDTTEGATPTFAPVDPLAADPKASASDPYLAGWSPSVTPSGRLVVFLPASGAKPADYQAFLGEACKLGHRVLALSGPGSLDVATLCGPKVGCQEAVRLEILDGQDHTDKVAIQPADAVETRVTRALLWLETHEPEGGWTMFQQQGKPDWSTVIAAGHGQGGAQAMMLASKHAVARVALLAAPTDGDTQGPAPWLATHQTPSQQIAGFAHTADPQFAAIAQAWTVLGLGGKSERVDVDVQGPPYWTNRQLVASAACAQPAQCVALDPKFVQVWRALVGKAF